MSRSVYPLLLEPTYWNQRLSELQTGPVSMFSSPREDLSGSGRMVEEFRLKAHDGHVLWGLISYPTLFPGSRPCCIRAAGPADPLELDPQAQEVGMVEILYQVPAGRRLEDRVIDLLRIHALARRQSRVQAESLRLVGQGGIGAAVEERVLPEQEGADLGNHKGTTGSITGSPAGSTAGSTAGSSPASVKGSPGSPHQSDELWIAQELLRRMP